MLGFQNISLRRGPRILFENVTFTVFAGQRLGLTGANGSGKSSLFALARGELEADSGSVTLPERLTVAHVAQETPAEACAAVDYVIAGDAELAEIHSGLTRAERDDDGTGIGHAHQRLDAIGGYDATARAARLMRGLGFAQGQESTPVRDLSGGWRMRLNLGRALMCRSDLLLLDEPTNHLDLDAVIWLGEWLQRYAGTLLVISHDRDFLDAVTTHTAHIERRQITLYVGNYSAFEAQRAARMANEMAAFEKQQRQAKHMQQFVDRFRYKASKARQAQSRIKALEKLTLAAPAHADSPFDFAFAAPDKLPRPLVRLDDAAAGYADKKVLSGVTADISPGDRIGLLGANGAGKSTFIRLIAGLLDPLAGSVQPAANLAVGYFAQHQLEQLDVAASPMQLLTRIDADDTREQAQRDFLGGFGFRAERIFEACGSFSGGEKARLVLALLMRARPNLLLLDEPTNHLDIDMRHSLTVALQDFAGAVVVVSHDRHLLRATCDTMLLVAGGAVRPFDGDLDDYARWLSGRQRVDDEADTEPPPVMREDRRAQRQREAALRQRMAPQRARLARIERALEKLQRKQTTITERLNEPSLYEDGQKDRLRDLLADQATVSRDIGELEDEWIQLTESLEQASAEPQADA